MSLNLFASPRDLDDIIGAMVESGMMIPGNSGRAVGVRLRGSSGAGVRSLWFQVERQR
jgi:hypothetical protein